MSILAPALGDSQYSLLHKIAGNSAAYSPVTTDPDALAQQARIIADGGTLYSLEFLDSLISGLKAASCYSLMDVIWPMGAVKLDGTEIDKVYDVGPSKLGAYYDTNTLSVANTILANQIDGNPIMVCGGNLSSGYRTVAVPTIALPLTVFVVCKKTAANSATRTVLQLATAATTGPLFRYEANTTTVGALSGATLTAEVTVETFGMYTILFNGASSTIRRNKLEVAAGNTGTTTASDPIYSMGISRTGTSPHLGQIAFVAAVRQSITETQRDNIENVISSLFPSAS